MSARFHIKPLVAIDAAEAACRGMDTALFISDEMTPGAVAQAKAVCAGCSQREPCLAFALVHHEAGVWGGMSDRERRAMGRKPRRSTGHPKNCRCDECRARNAENNRRWRARNRGESA